jgi:amino acid adenylation domain-containing protein/non-ribosomal peptide synthase protein (TIGR01720 family)
MPTVAGLSQKVQEAQRNGEELPPPLTRVDRNGELPLSFAQERLWFLDQLEPGSVAYNMPGVVRIRGDLLVGVLEGAINEMVGRHEALRTRFEVRAGVAVQVVEPEQRVEVVVEDVTGMTEEAQAGRIRELAMEEGGRPFDLTKGLLLRVKLVRLGKDEHVLFFTLHHIVSDGWSMGVLVREFVRLYEAFAQGQPSPLGELPVQYADYAVWQRGWLQGEVLEKQLGYWKEQLQGAPVLELPTDRPRPAVQSHRGASQRVILSGELTDGLQALSQQEGATLFMMLSAAFKVLLSRYSGQEDVMVGTAIANRNRTETEGLIGFFVNTLALRTDLGGDPSFLELLKREREVALEAYGHQDVPFEKVVAELGVERDLSRSPLFQVMLVLQNAPLETLKLEGLEFAPVEVEQRTAKFDLTLTLEETAEGLGGSLEYSADLFDGETIRRLLGHWEQLLREIVSDPNRRLSELEIMSERERHQLLVEWNDTEAEYPREKCIHELFEEQVERTPGAVAVVFEDKQLTYRELNEQANQLGHYLRKLGVGPEVVVGICIERSLEMVVGLLGILKAGGAYVPLDPEHPQERLRFLLEDAGAGILVTQENLIGRFEGWGGRKVSMDGIAEGLRKQAAGNLSGGARRENLAYVIYTSGSTGRPKGVMISHGGLTNYVSWSAREYRMEEGAGSVVHSSIGFDLTITGLLMPLITGQRVTLAPEGAVVGSLEWLVEGKRDLSLLKVTPGHLQVLRQLAGPGGAAGISRTFVIGGEALMGADVEFWQRHAPGTRLINEYGPTETVVGCCVYEVRANDKLEGGVPIGRAIANTQMYVLGREQEAIPVGVAGEMYIGGDGVGRGYLKRADLTAERFIPDPFTQEGGRRMYRTGDMGRYLADGNIQYIGRADHQVKVRGYRIELGEVESVMRGVVGVKEAVVVVREEESGQKRLVGYVVGEDVEVEKLRGHMRQRLPDYMVPGMVMVLKELPLTANGKVDRKALPEPEGVQDLKGEYIEARTPEERKLVEIWREVLKVERVGVRDNFFEMGGDSILSIQVIARANDAGMGLTPRQLFEHQTIEELAEMAGGQVKPEAEQGLVKGGVEMTPIQQWFFGRELRQRGHYNQSVMLKVEGLKADVVEAVVKEMVKQHDALRMRYKQDGKIWQQVNQVEEEQEIFARMDMSGVGGVEQDRCLREEAEKVQRSLDLERGPLMRVVWYELGGAKGVRLLIVIHHLVTDGVSWRILLEDLQKGCRQVQAGEVAKLGAKTSSYQQWARRLKEYGSSEGLASEKNYWREVMEAEVWPLPVDREGGENTVARQQAITVGLSEEETRALLQEVPEKYHTRINDALLMALGQALGKWTGRAEVMVELEGHGREDLFEELDVTRTVGWFTTMYPVVLPGVQEEAGRALKRVKERLREVPWRGIGYGLLRCYGGEELSSAGLGQVVFNYLGQLDQVLEERGWFGAAGESRGCERGQEGARGHVLEVNGQVLGSRLQVSWGYSEEMHRKETVEGVAREFVACLRRLIAHCRTEGSGGYTPSDFPLAKLDQEELDKVLSKIKLH